MNRALTNLVILLSMTACGGSDFSTAAGSGGRKATGSGGTVSNEGGATATTLPAADCASLWKTYLTALELARVCEAGKGTEACRAEWVLPGACNCSVLVNGASSAYTTAKARYDAYEAASCSVDACATVDCMTSPGADVVPTCKSSGNGNAMTCQW